MKEVKKQERRQETAIKNGFGNWEEYQKAKRVEFNVRYQKTEKGKACVRKAIKKYGTTEKGYLATFTYIKNKLEKLGYKITITKEV